MTAVLAIARITTRQLLGFKRLLGFGLLTVSPAALYYIATNRAAESDLLDIFLGIGLGTFFVVAVPIITLIIAASALGDERRDSTLSFIVLRPLSRVSIAGAKLGAAFLGAFALTGAGAFLLGVSYGVRASEWGYVVPMVLATAIATAVYASIFVPLGYLAERSTLFGLAYVFIWENGVAAVTGLSSTSPWRIGYSAFFALVPEEGRRMIEDFDIPGIDGGLGAALITAAVFLLLSVAFITWVLRRRDLV